MLSHFIVSTEIFLWFQTIVLLWKVPPKLRPFFEITIKILKNDFFERNMSVNNKNIVSSFP